MKKNILLMIATIVILLIIFLTNFFFINVNFFAHDIDKNISEKYDYLSETETQISSSLIGFLVKDDTGIHYAKTAISGKETNIIPVKKGNKYIVIIPAKYKNKTINEILKVIETTTIKTKNTNIITIDKVRTYTKVNPLNIFPYKDENGVFRLQAENLTYNTLDTPNVIFFEQTPTNNGYDAEVYYDSKNTYYIITPYTKEAIVFLSDGYVNIPEELYGGKLKSVDDSVDDIEEQEIITDETYVEE